MLLATLIVTISPSILMIFALSHNVHLSRIILKYENSTGAHHVIVSPMRRFLAGIKLPGSHGIHPLHTFPIYFLSIVSV